jgi:hypothetical protein
MCIVKINNIILFNCSQLDSFFISHSLFFDFIAAYVVVVAQNFFRSCVTSEGILRTFFIFLLFSLCYEVSFRFNFPNCNCTKRKCNRANSHDYKLTPIYT